MDAIGDMDFPELQIRGETLHGAVGRGRSLLTKATLTDLPS